MPENVIAELAQANIEQMQPPGKNADALIAEAGAAGEGQAAPLAPEVQAGFFEAGNGGGGSTSSPSSSSPSSPAAETFDPELHEAGPDGKGIVTTSGAWKKRRGRKPARGPGGHFAKSNPAPAFPASASDITFTQGPAPDVASAAPPTITREAARVAAEQLVGFAVSLAVGTFGDEWQPEKKDANPMGIDEMEALTDAATEYLFSEQLSGLSPGWSLTLAAGMYSGKRVSRPKTREKIAGWLKRGVLWFRSLMRR